MRRFWKEFRCIARPFFVMIGIIPLSIIIDNDLMKTLIPIRSIHILCCIMMGCAVFGNEFEYNTMERYLCQPLKRIRLWREKMAVLGFCVTIPFILHLFVYINIFLLYRDWLFILKHIFLHGLLYLVALSVAPLATLYLKKPHTAFWATLASTGVFVIVFSEILLSVLILLLKKSWGDFIQKFFISYEDLLYIGMPLLLWCLVCYFLARHNFIRLEISGK